MTTYSNQKGGYLGQDLLYYIILGAHALGVNLSEKLKCELHEVQTVTKSSVLTEIKAY